MPEPIKITFLGTGAAIPTVRRHHPGILIHYGPDFMLWDCGEGTQLRLEKVKVSPLKINKIFITHWHADHFGGLLPLIETLHLCRREEPLEIYGPDASRFVDALVEMSYWGIGFEIKVKECGKKPIEKIFENDRYEVYSVKVKHSVPSVGYFLKEKDHWNIDTKKALKLGLKGKILKQIKEKGKVKVKNKIIRLEQIAKKTVGRKVLYSGDTLIHKPFFESAKNADLLIHDGTFVEEFPKRAHASANKVIELAKEYKIKKLILTHISRRYTDKEFSKKLKKYKNVLIAKDMMRIKI
jgi:ribonuclease Z